jgi:hypothetical protein
VTDPLLGRVLGMDGTGALWDWHGAGWDREVVIGASHLGLLAFDGTRGGVLCCLPESGGGTWLFRELPVTSATFSASGQGCAGPLGTPLLAPVAGAVPRLGRVFSLHMAAVPDSPLNLAFGVMGSGNVTWSGGALPYDLTAIGAPSCLMQVDPQVAVPLPIQNQGAAWDIQIPAAQVLAGTVFFVQGAVVVPGWNAAGLVVSNAGQGVVGSR